jgi:hypothetical protein
MFFTSRLTSVFGTNFYSITYDFATASVGLCILDDFDLRFMGVRVEYLCNIERVL